MIRIIAINVCLILGSLTTYGQSSQWAPAGAEWYYNLSGHQIGYAHVESIRDTFLADAGADASICSHKVVSDYESWDTIRTFSELEFVTYATGDTIMARWQGEETVFFIQRDSACWNYNSPDSLYWDAPDTATICVDSVGRYSIGDTNFSTAYYATFKGQNTFGTNGPFVPNIGFVNYFLPEPAFVPHYTYKGPIRCYYDPANGLLRFNDTIACDSLYKTGTGVGALPDISDKVQVWPNPADNALNVAIPATAHTVPFEIVGVSGRVVNRGSVTAPRSRVMLSDLPKGVYVIRLEFEKASPVSRKFIKH